MSAPTAGFMRREVTVPVRKDTRSFEERQKTIWEEMHEQMERRRQEWEQEVSDLKKDFFRLKPDVEAGGRPRSSGDTSLERMDLNSMFYEKGGPGGEKVFRVCFDVAQFNPEEVSVRCLDGKLVVYARHEETQNGKMTSREFSRKVDIPPGIDPQSLRSTLSKDGILQVEADVSAPTYDLIRNDRSDRMCNLAHSPQALLGSGAITQGMSPQGQGQPSQAMMAYVDPKDGSKTFRVSVDIGPEFRPDELQVKTVDRKLVVHAKHEERSQGRTSCKEFNREFDLPDTVDPNLITANMTGNGVLILEAPFIAR